MSFYLPRPQDLPSPQITHDPQIQKSAIRQKLRQELLAHLELDRTDSMPSRRAGWLSMELVFVLPILLFLLLGLLEFSLLFFARAEVTEATRTGARMATLAGISEDDVISAVRKTLSPRLHGGLSIHVDLGQESGDAVIVAVRVPMNAASPDLLWPIGYSLQRQYLYAETSYLKE
ncbi:MAG: TadE/TadG family type IV pilus assembly protein [Planctomycetaceae bacterium]